MDNRVIFRGDPNQKICSFTFDDGPYRLPLALWLDALEQCGALGTFFATGEWVDKYPNDARNLLARGHELAPHSYNHRRMSQIPKDVFFDELKQTELAFQEVTGQPVPTFMRFPSRDYKEINLDWLDEWGYIDVEGEDTMDWAGISSEQIISNASPVLESGAIIVLHFNDVSKGTPGALQPLIRSAQDRGLTPVKLSEMLTAMGMAPNYRSWKICIDVPGNELYSTDEWVTIRSKADIRELAEQSFDWGLVQIPTGFASAQQWLRQLSEPLKRHHVIEDRSLFVAQYFVEQYWAYARAGIDGDDFVLLDIAIKEPQADCLVYILRWAAKAAANLGCKRIVARQDMRRMQLMCNQMGWTSEIIVDK